MSEHIRLSSKSIKRYPLLVKFLDSLISNICSAMDANNIRTKRSNDLLREDRANDDWSGC